MKDCEATVVVLLIRGGPTFRLAYFVAKVAFYCFFILLIALNRLLVLVLSF